MLTCGIDGSVVDLYLKEYSRRPLLAVGVWRVGSRIQRGGKLSLVACWERIL